MWCRCRHKIYISSSHAAHRSGREESSISPVVVLAKGADGNASSLSPSLPLPLVIIAATNPCSSRTKEGRGLSLCYAKAPAVSSQRCMASLSSARGRETQRTHIVMLIQQRKEKMVLQAGGDDFFLLDFYDCDTRFNFCLTEIYKAKSNKDRFLPHDRYPLPQRVSLSSLSILLYRNCCSIAMWKGEERRARLQQMASDLAPSPPPPFPSAKAPLFSLFLSRNGWLEARAKKALCCSAKR